MHKNISIASRIAFVCVLLAALVLAVFGQTIGFGFVNYDDGMNVYSVPQVVAGLSARGIAWAFSHTQIGHWDPLTTLSHMLDCQLYGLHPWGHHLTNVLLHTLAVLLLFAALRQMTGSLWRSAFVAAVFAIHPLRAESVAWISERKDVLSGVFFMATLLAYGSYVRRPGSRWRYWSVVALFILALMSKSMVVTLPFILLLLDYWPLRRFETGREEARWLRARLLIQEKVPLFLLSILFAAIQVAADKRGLVSLDNAPLLQLAGNALVEYAVYLRQMVWPSDLAAFYPHPGSDLSVWAVLLASVILAVLTAGAISARKQQPWLLVGWLWYLAMLTPVIGIVQSGDLARADRYTYLPMVGICLAATWAATDFARAWRHRREALAAAAAAILCSLLIAGLRQTAYWRDSGTLWSHTLACTVDNSIAHNNLGEYLFHLGQKEDAIAQFQTAVQESPGNAEAYANLGGALLDEGNIDEAILELRQSLAIDPTITDACYDLGDALLREGRAGEAIAPLRQCLAIDPTDANAGYLLGNALLRLGRNDEAIAQYREVLHIDPADSAAHNNLGVALRHEGRAEEALAEYREAIRLDPAYFDAHHNLGSALLDLGQTDNAIAEYRAALQANPASARTHSDLAAALLRQGAASEAIANLQQALSLEPANPDFLNALAIILAAAPQSSLRDGPLAVQLAAKASEATGGANPVILRTLAAAYAQAGRFPEAAQTAQKALHLAEAQSVTSLADALRREIKLYEARRPLEDIN
jgi:tetratricopeptide (TPR) repeat protein